MPGASCHPRAAPAAGSPEVAGGDLPSVIPSENATQKSRAEQDGTGRWDRTQNGSPSCVDT